RRASGEAHAPVVTPDVCAATDWGAGGTIASVNTNVAMVSGRDARTSPDGRTRGTLMGFKPIMSSNAMARRLRVLPDRWAPRQARRFHRKPCTAVRPGARVLAWKTDSL